VKEKQAVGSTFPGTLSSDRIPKSTKDVSLHLFNHRNNSCKSHQRIPGTFGAITYLILKVREDSHFFLVKQMEWQNLAWSCK